MDVLAHIVLNSDGVAPEPAATKAFAFILSSDREAATQYDAIAAAFAEDIRLPVFDTFNVVTRAATTRLSSTPPSSRSPGTAFAGSVRSSGSTSRSAMCPTASCSGERSSRRSS